MQLKVLVLIVLVTCAFAGAVSAKPVKLWELTGLETPESALADAQSGVIYVSNIAGEPTVKDGNGYISIVSLAGKMLTPQWVTGLDAPKGLARVGDRLYVADIDRLVEIGIADGEIVASHAANGAKFLNDVAVDGEGRVYVSDTATNVIWRLADGKFEPWLESKDLNGPNGLLVEGDKLIVAAWGVMPEGGKPGVPASLLSVSLVDKTIKPVGDGTPVGNLDGLEPGGPGSYLVTDWVSGALYRIAASGKAELLLDFNQGSADIEYLPASKTVLIPLMMENRLEAYKVGD